jgi:uncharacterized protein (TIGR00297 family)
MISQLLMFILVILGAIKGYQSRLLTKSGAIAAVVVGLFTALGFGWKGFIVLGLFFSSSSYWSKYKHEKKQKAEQKLAKTSCRDWQQVAANGGIAALCGLLYFFHHHVVWELVFFISIASANSDTWASEIGTLSKARPFFIRTFKRTEKGTSGAVSALGTFAGLGGAFLIAIVSSLLFALNWNYFYFIFFYGFFGNIIDTILGAFVQASYSCPDCSAETEKTLHCGKPTKLKRGISFINNDAVNFLSGLIASIIGGLHFLRFL